MIQRVLDFLKKLEMVIDVERDPVQKKVMQGLLVVMQKEIDTIVKHNLECPPDLAIKLETYISDLEQSFDKKIRENYN